MAPYDELLARLNTSEETRELAHNLHTQASQLTKQGSGRSLGLGHNALIAICTFLASQRLGNGDVTRDQACAAACVDPKTFDTALSNVERALSASSPSRPSRKTITYMSLCRDYVAREDAFVPMKEVEEALKGCRMLVDGSPIDLESALMQCAIFYWVCTAILKLTNPHATHLQQVLRVTPKKWSSSQRVLEKHCSHMAEDLIRNAEMAAAASATRATRSQTQAATKKTSQTSLTSLTNRPVGSIVPLTPKSSRVQGMKRKAPELEQKERESPSKRSRASTYVPSGLGQDLTMHTPKSKRGNAADITTPTRTATKGDEEESDEASNDTIVVRSARSSRKQLDHSPWESQRPTVTAVECESPISVSSTPGSPSAGIIAMNSTPMTSTGTSDTFSPSSPSRSSARVRAHLHSPLNANAYSLQSQEEEVPRRRRRNLRAAFLNADAYGWKPTGITALKLERAREWEAGMIAKYGDPWDAR